MWHFKKATQSLSTKDKISYIFIMILIFLNSSYKYATLGKFYNLLSIINFNFEMFFKRFFKNFPKTSFELTSIYQLRYCRVIHPFHALEIRFFSNVANLFAICNFSIMSVTSLNANWFYADIDVEQFRILLTHFCLQLYFTKYSVSQPFAQFSVLWGGHMVDNEGDFSEI